MTDVPSDPGPTPDPDPDRSEPGPAPGPWDVLVNAATGEAYRPAELLIEQGDQDRLESELPDGVVLEIIETIDVQELAARLGLQEQAPPNAVVVRLVGGDPAVVDDFIRRGVAEGIGAGEPIRVEHNTVFMADAMASPVWASPVWASPVWASPVWASPVWASGRTANQALPADRAGEPHPDPLSGDPPSTVIILDSGLADVRQGTRNAPILQGGNVTTPDPWEQPDENGDLVLDPVAGHGTFIAGLVQLAAPGVPMVVCDVMRFRGDLDKSFLAAAVSQVTALADSDDTEANLSRTRRTVIGMSFSGPISDLPTFTRLVLRFFEQAGIVVVAAAGNDSTCDRMYPAAFGDPTDPDRLENVVSVGALGKCGPAPFTNYGPWVRACADGELLTSSFFSYDEPHGPFRQFDGWATWSGTSFSVGVVIGALVRSMWATGETGMQTVGRLIDDPDLPKQHNLGTIVT